MRSSSFSADTARQLRKYRNTLARMSNEFHAELEFLQFHYIDELDRFVLGKDLKNHRDRIKSLCEELEVRTMGLIDQFSDFVGLSDKFTQPAFTGDVMVAFFNIRATMLRAVDRFRDGADDTKIIAVGDRPELEIEGIVYKLTDSGFGYREVQNGMAFLVSAYHAIAGTLFKFEPGSADRLQDLEAAVEEPPTEGEAEETFTANPSRWRSVDAGPFQRYKFKFEKNTSGKRRG